MTPSSEHVSPSHHSSETLSQVAAIQTVHSAIVASARSQRSAPRPLGRCPPKFVDVLLGTPRISSQIYRTTQIISNRLEGLIPCPLSIGSSLCPFVFRTHCEPAFKTTRIKASSVAINGGPSLVRFCIAPGVPPISRKGFQAESSMPPRTGKLQRDTSHPWLNHLASIPSIAPHTYSGVVLFRLVHSRREEHIRSDRKWFCFASHI